MGGTGTGAAECRRHPGHRSRPGGRGV